MVPDHKRYVGHPCTLKIEYPSLTRLVQGNKDILKLIAGVFSAKVTENNNWGRAIEVLCN